jgi:hypothetical protein
MESLDIAIIGMSGRFPGADNLDQFWLNLRDGVESIRRFTDEELKSFGVSPEALDDPNFVKAGAILETLISSTRGSSATRRKKLKSWTRNSASFWNARGKPWKTPAMAPILNETWSGFYGDKSEQLSSLSPDEAGGAVGGYIPVDDRQRQGFPEHARLL